MIVEPTLAEEAIDRSRTNDDGSTFRAARRQTFANRNLKNCIKN
jgi:hypothetical protein